MKPLRDVIGLVLSPHVDFRFLNVSSAGEHDHREANVTHLALELLSIAGARRMIWMIAIVSVTEDLRSDLDHFSAFLHQNDKALSFLSCHHGSRRRSRKSDRVETRKASGRVTTQNRQASIEYGNKLALMIPQIAPMIAARIEFML